MGERREPHAILRELIEIRRANFFLTEGADVAVTEIVGQEEDDVGSGGESVAADEVEDAEANEEAFHRHRYGIHPRLFLKLFTSPSPRKAKGGAKMGVRLDRAWRAVLHGQDAKMYFPAMPSSLTKAAFLRRINASQLAQLFDFLPEVSFFIKDRTGRFMALNQRGCEYCRVQHEHEAIGKTDRDFVPKSRADEYARTDAAVRRAGQGMVKRVLSAPERAGSPRLISTTMLPLRDTRGRVIGVAGFSRPLEQMRESSAQNGAPGQSGRSHAPAPRSGAPPARNSRGWPASRSGSSTAVSARPSALPRVNTCCGCGSKPPAARIARARVWRHEPCVVDMMW